MKAVLLKGHGGFDQLEYRDDVPVPEPRAGELLVRVGACGVNNTDINTRTAWYSRAVTQGTTATGAAAGIADADPGDSGWTGTALRFPRIQGADACGRIVAVGAGVDSARIGERVLIEPVFRIPGVPDPLRTLYFGSEVDGAFAEFARVPSLHAHRIASALTDVELASFPCAYGAAENMMARAAVAAGETVLITGASGGVGSAAVQLARRRGAKVIAIAARAKAAAVGGLGASQVIDRDEFTGGVPTGDAAPADAAMGGAAPGIAATAIAGLGAESVDVVIDVVGGAQFPRLLDLLRRGGRYAVAGAIAGPVVPLDLRTVYLKDLTLLGCTVLGPDVFRQLVGYIERGEIRPVVASVHPLSAIVAAQQEFLTKQHTGKIVLVPS